MKINRLVLASSSPFRSSLLKSSGVDFDVMKSKAIEEDVQAEHPLDMARLRSEHKATGLEVLPFHYLAITADQVLNFQDHPYGKASHRDEAKERLQLFSGKTHELLSAYSLVLVPSDSPMRILKTRVVAAKMHMRQLPEEDLNAYLDTGEWQGCAGCYQFENRGIHLFAAVEGHVSTIIGLPMLELLEDLRSLGLNALRQPRGPWDLLV
ncbi:MAG: Maf family protein [Oligoflexus sp.]